MLALFCQGPALPLFPDGEVKAQEMPPTTCVHSGTLVTTLAFVSSQVESVLVGL